MSGQRGAKRLRDDLGLALTRAAEQVARVAADPDAEHLCRQASTALYDVTSAVLLAAEGVAMGARDEDARRLLLSRLVLDHRLSPADPLGADSRPWESACIDHLLEDAPVSLDAASELLAA